MFNNPKDLVDNIALLNFGGIGDEILFEPVIRTVRQVFPQATITLFLEGRSKAATELLQGLNAVEFIDVQSRSRAQVFTTLLKRLQAQPYDLVVSSGSSPFIPVMLFLTGIGFRFGFDTGMVSRFLLTKTGALDLETYASNMYFSLAQSVINHFDPEQTVSGSFAVPQLNLEETKQKHWQRKLHRDDEYPSILVHPGVSQVSQDKNIIKRWPPEHWAQTILALTKFAHVHLIGGPDDLETITDISQNLPGQLINFTNHYGETESLADLAAMINGVDLMLCLDSAPMHVAVGLNKPLVALFGMAMAPKRLLPDQENFTAIQSEQLSDSATYIDIDSEIVIRLIQKKLNG